MRVKADARFWEGYLRLGSDGALRIDPSDYGVVALEFGEERALEVHLTKALAALILTHPDLPEPVGLGWDDDARWHPHALRWPEVPKLAARVTNCSPEEALLFLVRFTFVERRRHDAARALIAGALDAIVPELATEAYLDRIMDDLDVRDASWRLVAGIGWIAEDGAPDGYLYSLRSRENPVFPHAELADVLGIPATPRVC